MGRVLDKTEEINTAIEKENIWKNGLAVYLNNPGKR